jgi:hypothetical protein
MRRIAYYYSSYSSSCPAAASRSPSSRRAGRLLRRSAARRTAPAQHTLTNQQWDAPATKMAEMLIAEERRNVVEENELIKLVHQQAKDVLLPAANKIDWYTETIATRVLYNSKICKNTINSLYTQYNSDSELLFMIQLPFYCRNEWKSKFRNSTRIRIRFVPLIRQKAFRIYNKTFGIIDFNRS